jgi:hypothetical protein
MHLDVELTVRQRSYNLLYTTVKIDESGRLTIYFALVRRASENCSLEQFKPVIREARDFLCGNMKEAIWGQQTTCRIR